MTSKETVGDAAVLRHELRTPINAILGYSELLLEDFSDDLTPEIVTDMNTVVAECSTFLSQVDGLLDVSRGHLDTQSLEADVGIAAALERTLTNTHPDQVEAGRILVIDDVPANRDLLRRHLIRRGHTVEAVGTAAAALELLQETSFEVLLVDVLMPDMNGIELLAHMKTDVALRDIPVIMISGLKENAMVVRCIAAGAEDYLQKPVDPHLLHSRIGTCLERVRWRDQEKRYLDQIEYERDRADALLQNMLPTQIIERLQRGEKVIADRVDNCTVLFADIVDFTVRVGEVDPPELLRQLAGIFSMFDDLADHHGVEKIKTIGDAYMAVAGIPEHCEDHAARGLALGRDMIHAMEDGAGHGLSIRIGLHSGPVIAGLIGRKRFVYDVWGQAVNIASRLETSSQPGNIHMSAVTYSELKTQLGPREPQIKALKGIGQFETYLIDHATLFSTSAP